MAGFFSKLKGALSKTSSKITSGIEHVLIKKKLDDETLEELEDLLISSDVGTNVSSAIIDSLRAAKFNKEVSSEEVKQHMAGVVSEILQKQDHQFEIEKGRLNVVLVCGVNGNGKTTTIGKMSELYKNAGHKVAIAACDTFRAAATEQIEEWAKRSSADFFQGEHKADPASVAFKAVTECLDNGTDILFIDTAGRLHNHKNLMDELSKIIKVIKKADPSAPHHSLLVIDATTGQNATMQVEQFKEHSDISGLVITKLDGTAKAGALVGIVQKFNVPVHFIGIGEAVDDLKPFISKDFAASLVGIGER